MLENKITKFYNQGYGVSVKNTIPFLNAQKESKEKLIKFLGGQKLEKDIDITIRDKDLQILIDQFIKKYQHLNEFFQNLTYQEIINNQLLKNLQKFNLQKGIKISKAIGKIVENNATQAQIDFSMLLQKCSTKGKLVLSVEPLDMLTMSMNNKNWTSCLNLNSGDYRGGVYPFTMDKTTLIAYLYTDEAIINGVEMPDKIWRQLIHINLDRKQAIFSKNYPYYSKTLSFVVRQMVEETLSKHFNIENNWILVKKMNIIRSAILDEGDTFSYNDILLSSGEIEKGIMAIYHKRGNMNLEIPVGELKILCPVCGENYIGSDDMIMCSSCDGMSICSECNQYSWNSYMVNGVCRDCM